VFSLCATQFFVDYFDQKNQYLKRVKKKRVARGENTLARRYFGKNENSDYVKTLFSIVD
jgi:hypothetical protein